MSHTPGPWAASETGTKVLDANGHRIAEVHGRGLADARLIAAAPDLLEATRNAHTTLTLNPDTLTPGSDEWHTMERLLAFAIEKATGVSVSG